MKRHSLSFSGRVAWAVMAFSVFGIQGASACATCFGQTDSALGRGLNWGIFALLVVVGMVLAGICSFFVFVARRAALVEREMEQERLGQDGTVGANPQAKASSVEETV